MDLFRSIAVAYKYRPDKRSIARHNIVTWPRGASFLPNTRPPPIITNSLLALPHALDASHCIYGKACTINRRRARCNFYRTRVMSSPRRREHVTRITRTRGGLNWRRWPSRACYMVVYISRNACICACAWRNAYRDICPADGNSRYIPSRRG